MKGKRYSIKGMIIVNVLTFLVILGGLVLGGMVGGAFSGDQGVRVGAAIGGIAALIYASGRRSWKNLIYKDEEEDGKDGRRQR